MMARRDGFRVYFGASGALGLRLMNRLQFQQVESLFEVAVGCDAPARQMLLERISSEHSREIREMVERLLECDRSQTRWSALHTPPAALPAEPAGTTLDRFRLIERLGVGGHGEVYLAEQLAPVRRQVALKMVRVGAMSQAAVERFRAEQQALALMNHPGIASVYEAALSDQGRLFFAMEYVRGEPIDAWCDARALTVPQRLQLFLKVCQAVQHAHQKGVIHRDLKPSNILVTERDGVATPVLIDFGIALVEAGSNEGESSTRPAFTPAGTPAYMSPEQAAGAAHDIDTRTDIYALGVVLCELLVGRTPLDATARPGAGTAEIRRCIIESTAPAPSSLLNAAKAVELATKRGCTVPRLRTQVAGDLDAITLKALARDRNDRYQTVEALAGDVGNHLQHRPVNAVAAGPAMRLRKFVRRHRVAVGVACALLTILAVGATAVTLAMLRAERSAERSLAMNVFLRDLLTSSRPLEKGATVSFAEVLEGGSAMAGDRFADFPEQEGEIRFLIGQTYYSLGLLQEARTQLEQSVALLRKSIGVDDTRTLHAMTFLAMTFLDEHRLKQAESLSEEIAAVSADRPMPHREHFLAAQRILSCVVGGRGEYRLATERLKALIPQIDAELGQDHLTAYSARMSLSQALRRRAADEREKAPTQQHDQYKKEEEAILRETVHIQQARFGVEDAYPVLASQMKLAEVLVETRQFAEAQQIAEALVPRVKTRFGTSHWMFGSATITLASVRSAQGDAVGAADAFAEAVNAWQGMHTPSHPIVLGAKRDFLSYLDDAGRLDDGLRIARELDQTLSAELGGHGLLSLELQAWIARFASRKGMMAEADRIYASFEPHAEELVNDSVGRIIMLFHAGHLAKQGRFEEAEAELFELARRQKGVGSGVNYAHPDDIAQMFVEVYEAWGREDKAQEYRELAQAIREGRPVPPELEAVGIRLVEPSARDGISR